MNTIFIHYLFMILLFFSSFCFATTGGNSSSRNMNFYGTLETHSNNNYSIEQITINGKRTFKAYEEQKIQKHQHDSEKNVLSRNPLKESAMSILELNEINTISVPYPNQIFIFQKNNRGRTYTFLKIEVTSNKGRKRNYLIEEQIEIICNEIDKSGPIEKRVPLAAIKKITIQGHEISEKK